MRDFSALFLKITYLLPSDLKN